MTADSKADNYTWMVQFDRFDAVEHSVDDVRFRWRFTPSQLRRSLAELYLLLYWKAAYRLYRYAPAVRAPLHQSILDVYLGARLPDSSLRAQVVALRNQAQYRTEGAGVDVGYAPDEPIAKWEVLHEWFKDRPQKRLHMQMYLKVTALAELKDRRVLEVGCGQGDGAAFLTKIKEPRQYVGVDLHPAQLAICQRHFGAMAPRLVFVRGDAQVLPLANGMFDVALSVESSHSYPQFAQFVAEVHRALTPGGQFCFADLRTPVAGTACATQLRDTFETAGFAVAHHEDITGNAWRSLDELRTLRGGQLWDEFESLRALLGARQLEYHLFLLTKR